MVILFDHRPGDQLALRRRRPRMLLSRLMIGHLPSFHSGDILPHLEKSFSNENSFIEPHHFQLFPIGRHSLTAMLVDMVRHSTFTIASMPRDKYNRIARGPSSSPSETHYLTNFSSRNQQHQPYASDKRQRKSRPTYLVYYPEGAHAVNNNPITARTLSNGQHRRQQQHQRYQVGPSLTPQQAAIHQHLSNSTMTNNSHNGTSNNSSSSSGRNIISIRGVPFHKVRLLGEGYHSAVFEVVNLHSGIKCAMKFVSFAHQDPKEQKELHEMFAKELALLIKLNYKSQHIAKVYDYELDSFSMTGKLLMELGNEDFRSLMPLRTSPSSKIISEPKRKYYWRQMVEAVRVIHQNGITHSDVKPENFIFVNGILKIIDFGMSFLIPRGRTCQVRPFAGTPDYMPPEVCRPNGILTKFGYKADIWSLGCILFEMSFGVRPFEHIRGDIEKMVVIGALSRPIKIPPTNDVLLTNMLESCLNPKASSRPSAEQILRHPYLVYK